MQTFFNTGDINSSEFLLESKANLDWDKLKGGGIMSQEQGGGPVKDLARG
jgi:hypothetical protein